MGGIEKADGHDCFLKNGELLWLDTLDTAEVSQQLS